MNDAATQAFDLKVLEALLEGFRARTGAKERHQALSEYELARRVGMVIAGYVEYETSPEREILRAALGRLQRQGMIHSASVSGRYETFLPASGIEDRLQPGAEDASDGGPEPDRADAASAVAAEPAPERPMPSTFEGRLDEIIRLLRSIDEHLARITRS